MQVNIIIGFPEAIGNFVQEVRKSLMGKATAKVDQSLERDRLVARGNNVENAAQEQ